MPRTGALRDKHRLRVIFVTRRQGSGDKIGEVEQLVRAGVVSDGAVLPLIWGNPDIMAYARQESKYLNVRWFRASSSHGGALKDTYEGRTCTMVHGAWILHQKECENAEQYAADGMDISPLSDESRTVYVFNLSLFARNIAVGWYLRNWLGYFMLPWPWHTLPFLEKSKKCRSATKFERCHQRKSDGSLFAGLQNREFVLVAPKEWRRVYDATSTLRKEYGPCCAPTVPLSLVFA